MKKKRRHPFSVIPLFINISPSPLPQRDFTLLYLKYLYDN